MNLRNNKVLMMLSIFILTAISPLSAAEVDYAEGFNNLLKLGLPDVKDAQYINLSTAQISYYNSLFSSLQLSGNAWLLAENKDGLSRIVSEQRIIAIMDHELYMEKFKELSEQAKVKGENSDAMRQLEDFYRKNQNYGKWEKADLSKDIKKIIEFLDNDEKVNDYKWELESGGDSDIFLFSAFVYQKGYTTEANQIVNKLFKKAANPQKVILKSFNKIADAQYTEAYELFRKNHDWAAYEENLNKLIKRFPQGWNKSYALQRLLPLVRERALGNAVPALEGSGLSETDQELARGLVQGKSRNFQRLFSQGTWLFPDFGKNIGDEEIRSSVFFRIMERGIKSVPLLIALIKDDHLTDLEPDLVRYNTLTYDFYEEEDAEITEDIKERMFNSILRPVTRSDIAHTLLFQVLLPLEDPAGYYNSYSQMDKDQLIEEITAWYEGNKDKSPEELVLTYFQKGDPRQRSAALRYLLSLKEERYNSIIEDKLLGIEDFQMSFEMALEYAQALGPQAEEFVEKYIKGLESKISEQSQYADAEDSQYMQVLISTSIKSLRNLVKDEPLEKILEQLSSGESSLVEISTVLMSKLEKYETDKAMELLLKAALQTEDAKKRMEFLYLIGTVPHLKQNQKYAEDGLGKPVGFDPASPDPKPRDYDVTQHAGLWRKLLEDDSVIPMMPQGLTIGFFAATTIEGLSSYGAEALLQERMMRMGKRGYEFIYGLAEARLNGTDPKDIQAWPSPNNVKEERLTEILRHIATDPEQEMMAYLGGLTTDELLALQDVLPGRKDLYPKLLPAANRITRVHTEFKGEESIESVSGIKGNLASREIIEKVFDICRSSVKKRKNIVCTILRDPLFSGVEVGIIEVENDQNTNMIFQMLPSDQIFIIGMMQGNGFSENAQWSLQIDSEEKSPDGIQENQASDDKLEDEDAYEDMYMKEAQDSFWEKSEQVFGAEFNPATTVMISFIGVSGQ